MAFAFRRCTTGLTDKGYTGINERYEMVLSPVLLQQATKAFHQQYFGSISGSKITLPKKYLPKTDFLQYHMDTIFKQQA